MHYAQCIQRGTTMGFDKKKYDQQFQKDNYDRIALNVKKGDKAIIAEHAKKRGFSSITDYIKYAIYKDINENEKAGVHIETINNANGNINIG